MRLEPRSRQCLARFPGLGVAAGFGGRGGSVTSALLSLAVAVDDLLQLLLRGVVVVADGRRVDEVELTERLEKINFLRR